MEASQHHLEVNDLIMDFGVKISFETIIRHCASHCYQPIITQKPDACMHLIYGISARPKAFVFGEKPEDFALWILSHFINIRKYGIVQ